MTKYLIVAGFVYTKDGDKHFIDANNLIRLYGVNKDECIIHDHNHPAPKITKLIVLAPRMRGDYAEHIKGVSE